MIPGLRFRTVITNHPCASDRQACKHICSVVVLVASARISMLVASFVGPDERTKCGFASSSQEKFEQRRAQKEIICSRILKLFYRAFFLFRQPKMNTIESDLRTHLYRAGREGFPFAYVLWSRSGMLIHCTLCPLLHCWWWCVSCCCSLFVVARSTCAAKQCARGNAKECVSRTQCGARHTAESSMTGVSRAVLRWMLVKRWVEEEGDILDEMKKKK